MRIGEILELTKTIPLATIAKEHLTIGKVKVTEAMKAAGCYSKNGIKGWFYDGDASVLDQSIYNFVEPRPNVPTKKRINRTNQRSKVSAKEEIEQTNEHITPTKERTNVIRKRSSFDIDVELMKELKIQAIVHDRNVYEIVETAVRQYLNGLKKEK